MSRGRLLPSLSYRSKGLIEMSLSNQNLRGMDYFEVYAASNLDDAQNAPIKLFDVRYDSFFKSPSVLQSGRTVEESYRDLTKFAFNLNDYSTALKALGSRVPNDQEMCHIRLRGHLKSGFFTDFGPILGVVPYDFFSVTAPVFTCIGTAPDLNQGAGFPDVLDVGCVNYHLPYFSQTVNIQNIGEAADGNLLFSCAPGMSPSILRPGEVFGLTSGAVPEFFFGGQSGSPKFTLRCSLVNRG